MLLKTHHEQNTVSSIKRSYTCYHTDQHVNYSYVIIDVTVQNN